MTRIVVRREGEPCSTSRSSRIRRPPPSRWTRAGPAARRAGDRRRPARLAARVGITRQKVNYHLNALEAHGLVELAEERKRGGITERVLRATAATYVVSPGRARRRRRRPGAGRRPPLRPLPGRPRPAASCARSAAWPGAPRPRASACRRWRSTPRSASAPPRTAAAFADELTAAVLDLAARYHHDDGRPHRLVVAAHPNRPRRPHDHARRPAALRAHHRGARHARAGVGRHRHRQRHQRLVPADRPRGARGRRRRASTWARTRASHGTITGWEPPRRIAYEEPDWAALVGHDGRRGHADGHRVPGRGEVGRHLRRCGS